ncbi:MAG: acyl-CoA thioesterase [Betaproteobacteria bacterium]|nr:acyl-CoA thioesterase [Betaproteobacteria bacterium]
MRGPFHCASICDNRQVPRIHLTRIPVAAADIDINEHVNNLAYLRWMQDVATAHSAAQGWTLEDYRALGAGWFARSHYIEYLQPAHAGDVLLLHTWVASMKSSSCLRRFLFRREGDGKVVATAQTRWAFVDFATGRPVRIPPEVASAFSIVPDDDPELFALPAPSRAFDKP